MLDQLLGPCLFSYTLATFITTFLTTYKHLGLPYTPLRPTVENIYSHSKYNNQAFFQSSHFHFIHNPQVVFNFCSHISHQAFFLVPRVSVFSLLCFVLVFFFMHVFWSVYCSKRIMLFLLSLVFWGFQLFCFSVWSLFFSQNIFIAYPGEVNLISTFYT